MGTFAEGVGVDIDAVVAGGGRVLGVLLAVGHREIGVEPPQQDDPHAAEAPLVGQDPVDQAGGLHLAEDEFVRLYPMLPYQVQLLIDAVSARRAQGGATPMLGGSNRTIIKLAQQVVVNPKVGLGNDEVGALVTIAGLWRESGAEPSERLA